MHLFNGLFNELGTIPLPMEWYKCTVRKVVYAYMRV